MRWEYRDAALLWLFVPAYMTHVVEEWFGGFTTWAARFAGRPIPGDAFLVINGIALLLLIAAIRASSRDQASGWMAIAIATIALVNTASHLAGAIYTQSYSPGLVSAVILYVPLGSLTMVRASDQAPSTQLSRGIVAGMALHALVFVVAFAASRMSS
jgi:hypothetical protein